ncbi:C-Myc-binding -like protein [Labeo rohita]|uniref:c-Myc-binding-like protein n=1 Tax=Labeo rohita TaxID=84645 RepID=A0A498M801_LABRO|nr:C-Myc-binding -like protein [Labeo rohita]RXN15586.1 C-Myc-binding -like protein [Labeo rohita]
MRRVFAVVYAVRSVETCRGQLRASAGLTALTNPLISFIKHHLGAGPEADDAESLRLELSHLQQKYDQVMEENKELRNRLLQYEPAQDVGTE